MYRAMTTTLTTVNVLADWLAKTGLTKAELARAAVDEEGKPLRYATVHEIVEGRHVPGVEIAKRLAEASARLVRERGLEAKPVTPAEILGVADWEAA